jgi:hypothetical protein
MRIALGLLAAALAGEDGPPAPTAAAPVVSFRVQVLEMDGLDWRESIYFRLTPVDRQGTAAVWTTSRGIARSLRKQAGRVVSAPQVAAPPGTTAVIDTMSRRRYVAHLTRRADGPVNRATAVAFQPEAREIREGIRASLSGRAEGRGVRVRLGLDDTRVVSVHEVTLTEFVRDEEGVESYLRPSLEVPEVATARAGGEWLVPDDGVLVVSLGAQTVVDDESASASACVRERLVIVEPEQISAGPEAGPPRAAPPAPAPPRSRTLTFPIAPMMSPIVGPAPARAIAPPDPRSLILTNPLPQWDVAWVREPASAAHASLTRDLPPRRPAPPGRRCPPPRRDRCPRPSTRTVPPPRSPPLPDDELTPVAADDESAEPRPSPQTRPAPARPQPGPASADAERRPTGPIRPRAAVTSSVAPGRDASGRSKAIDPGVVQADLGGRPEPGGCAAGACPAGADHAPEPISIRIPLHGNRTIEIRASLTRTSGARPPAD